MAFVALEIAEQERLIEILARISRLVTIARIEGRVRGAGNEFVLTCDMRFAARESAIYSLPEQGFGLIPGAGGI